MQRRCMDWGGLYLLSSDSSSAEVSQKRPRPKGLCRALRTWPEVHCAAADSGCRNPSSETVANMRQRIAIFCLRVVLALPLATAAFAQNGTDWTEPFPPF